MTSANSKNGAGTETFNPKVLTANDIPERWKAIRNCSVSKPISTPRVRKQTQAPPKHLKTTLLEVRPTKSKALNKQYNSATGCNLSPGPNEGVYYEDSKADAREKLDGWAVVNKPSVDSSWRVVKKASFKAQVRARPGYLDIYNSNRLK